MAHFFIFLNFPIYPKNRGENALKNHAFSHEKAKEKSDFIRVFSKKTRLKNRMFFKDYISSQIEFAKAAGSSIGIPSMRRA